jgi:mannosyltransferase OCH1-like enzyme
MISKIIWQTHKWEYEDLPYIYKQTSLTWQKMNPDWEYKYLPNHKIRQMIVDLNEKSLLDAFDKSPDWLNKSDIYREVMVWAYGGIWADMDAICLSPIDKTIEKNLDKEMICSAPLFKFANNPEKNWEPETTESAINRILSGTECSYWIPNSIFIGKKKNIVSSEIINFISKKWTSESFMAVRTDLYQKYHEVMSLALVCGFHDGRFNDRNYPS